MQGITDIVSKHSNPYRQYYYPAASICHAYEPSVKPGEVLSDKFKAHKWWLPSAGELARIVYYIMQGNDIGNSQAVFAKANNMGLFSSPTVDYIWSSTEYNVFTSYVINKGNGSISNYYENSGKFYSASVRAITAF